MKYKEWLHDWLELYEKETVKPRSYKQYEDIIYKRLIPALGDYEIEDLTPIILQRYIVGLSKKGNIKTGKGLAPNSVNSIILVLRSSLSMAYILGLTKDLNVDKIKRPKTSEKPVESFSSDESILKIETSIPLSITLSISLLVHFQNSIVLIPQFLTSMNLS